MQCGRISTCIDSKNDPYNLVVQAFPSGKLVDIFDVDDLMRITDYSQVKRKIIFDDGKLLLGGEITRDKAGNINILRKYVVDIINIACVQLNKDNILYYALDFLGEKRDLLVNQLIWDVVLNTYLSKEQPISFSKYIETFKEWHHSGAESTTESSSLRKSKDRSLRQFYTKITSPEIQQQLEDLGISPVASATYFNPTERLKTVHERPRFIWDALYYNKHMITHRQYRRQLTRDSRNYSYQEFLRELKEYGAFVREILPEDNYSPQKFVERMVTYYCLETYKRIDWMLRVANHMCHAGITSVETLRSLIKPFHPQVLALVEDGENLRCFRKCNYYRAPLLMEHALLSNNIFKDETALSLHSRQLVEYNILRAKAYELLRLHVEYDSVDYKDIKDFILESYDIRICNNDNTEWYKEAKAPAKDTKAILNNVIALNSILFPASPKGEERKE